MNDLISRQALLEWFKNWSDYDEFSVGYITGVIEDEPPIDAVEVVRCENCKWCEAHYDTDGNAPYWICRNWVGVTDADGFCHEAERKTDG